MARKGQGDNKGHLHMAKKAQSTNTIQHITKQNKTKNKIHSSLGNNYALSASSREGDSDTYKLMFLIPVDCR